MEITIRLMLTALIRGAVEELKAQGHVASGEGIRSFEPRVLKPSPTFFLGQVLVNEYVMKLDKKQKPQVVPLGQLIRWASNVRSGLTAVEQTSFALRVRASIARVGIPSPGSYKFSKNRRRTGWVEFGAKASAKDMDRLIENSDYVETLLSMAIDEATRP